MTRSIGENDLSSGQSTQGVKDCFVEYHHALEIRELVGFPEEVPRVGGMVANHAE
jgi:hypothetical protein